MPPRDTVIEVKDGRLGYTARIRVVGDYVDIALSSERDSNGCLIEGVVTARDHLCQQARAAMAKSGRQGWLYWRDIVASVRQAERIKVDKKPPAPKPAPKPASPASCFSTEPREAAPASRVAAFAESFRQLALPLWSANQPQLFEP